MASEYVRAAAANGSSGACAVEVEQDPAPAAGLVEVTTHGGLLGVERVGQHHRLRCRRGARRSPAPWPGRHRCARRRRRGNRAAHGRSTPSARVRSSTSPRQAKASSSQRRPSITMPVSQCGQAAPPAMSSAVSRVVVGDGPVERRSQVVVLGVDRRQPRSLAVTGVRGCALRAQLCVVPGHRVPDAHRVAAFGEPFPAVLGECLQQGVPHPAGHRDGDHQRLVDQRPKMVGDVGHGDVIVGAHRLGRRQVAPTRQHREPFEDALLVAEQQLVAPVDDSAQRLLARQGRARPARQQAEPIVEPGGDLGERERPGPGRGQLDGQRQPVEPGADVGDDIAARRRARSARPTLGREPRRDGPRRRAPAAAPAR